MDDDLTKDELKWLMRMATGHATFIPAETAKRLIELGCATQLLGGPGITQKGRLRLLQGR